MAGHDENLRKRGTAGSRSSYQLPPALRERQSGERALFLSNSSGSSGKRVFSKNTRRPDRSPLPHGSATATCHGQNAVGERVGGEGENRSPSPRPLSPAHHCFARHSASAGRGRGHPFPG